MEHKDEEVTTGSCLCGAVSIDINEINKSVGTCHCEMCRKWSSGPFFAVDCGTEVEFQGQDYITTYQSSEWAERGFCSKCGSNLFYLFKDKNLYMLSGGLFSSVDFNFDHQVFIDDKPDYYDFANKTRNMTGDELVAEFTE